MGLTSITRSRGRLPRSRRVRGWARTAVVAAVAAVVIGSTQFAAQAAPPAAVSGQPAAAVPCPPTPAPAPTPAPVTAPLGGVFDGVALDSRQVTSASTIVSVAQSMGIARRGVRIAIAVAMQESSLNPAAIRSVYVGLFQQRTDPTTGLYLDYDRLDAAGATRMFFEQLVKRVPGYASDPRLDWEIGEVIQQTNVGRNVEQWFGLSDELTDRLTVAPMLTLVAPASRSTAAPSGLRSAGRAFAALDLGPVVAAPLADFSPAAIQAAADAPTPTASTTPAEAAPTAGASTSAEPPVPGETSTGTAPSTTGAPTESVPTSASPTASGGSVPSTTTTPASTTGATAPMTTAPATTGPATTGPVTTGPVTTGPVTGTTAPVIGGTPTPPSTVATAPVGTTAPIATTTRPAPPITAPSGTPRPTTAPVTTAPVATKPVAAKPVTAKPIAVKPATTTPASPTRPVNITVNPDPPEPAVPTGSTDPSVGADPTPAARTATPDSAAVTTPDCSPATGGGSTAFDPGMIISDAVFYNTRSMSAADIRTFIATKGAACTGAACLRSLRLSTPSKPADQYCAAYAGGTDEDVAAVLQRLSVACGINPQVMLVTLQKESALLTRTDVTMATYAAAYGWHCPDTGPGGSANCDPQYAGFFNQAYGMAKQWARYRIDPLKYNFHAGQTATILWNVAEFGCGGSAVYIRNMATASLYDYTPYQPNAASLAAYPGVGDRCSAYGNRNFFYLFQKYFGTTGGGVDQNVGLNGVSVTLPSGPHVAPGAAGKVITAPTAAVARGLAAGLAAVGLPYVYGGGTDGGAADQGCSRAGGASNSCQGIVGFDCSGLTAYVLMQAGVSIPTFSGAQRAAGVSVPWNQGRPGDIIGYQGHVAIYLGIIGGTPYLLEAPDVGMYVQVRPVYYTNGGVPVDNVLHRYWR